MGALIILEDTALKVPILAGFLRFLTFLELFIWDKPLALDTVFYKQLQWNLSIMDTIGS